MVVPKQTYDLDRPNRFLVESSPRNRCAARTQRARVIVGVSVDRYRSTGAS